MSTPAAPPPIPRSFGDYLRSFGPGLVAVLTWLGAGDVVEAGVSGGNYGYALMWIVVVALLIRFLFVSLIARYQLCNPRDEAVLDGLYRLNRFYAPGLLIACVVMGHIYGAYMAVGIGETWAKLTGFGATWSWAVAWTVPALLLAFRPSYRNIELVFKLLLALLSISFLGVALWVGPSPAGIVRGTLGFALPPQAGPFDSMLLAVGMIGAVGGSLMNLAYPYFIEQKGWRGPAYRRVQMYDFLLAVVVMIVLDLAIWVLGAELVHARGKHIKDLDGLTALLTEVLGEGGRVLFHLGVFAAVFTSILGHAVGLAAIGSHGHHRWKRGPDAPRPTDLNASRVYRFLVLWVLLSPLPWTLPGMPDFVTLTVLANSAQVLLIPFLAGGLWWITASPRFIGPQHRNRAWENALMAGVFALALWGAYNSVRTVGAALLRR
jgi:Mn2+/Fe2+ NRAMP family transporter